MADLPPGFELESRGKFDPLSPLLSLGIEPTNGYRTQGDIDRLKREGYTPASDSDHLRGDAVDLVPGKSGLTLAQLEAKAREQFGPEAEIGIHNGTHVHVSLKGWGQAPGTPGTQHSGLPELPEGFTLEQRGSLKGQSLDRPASVDYSEMTGDASVSTPVAPGSTYKTADNPEAAHLVDGMIRQGEPYAKALAALQEKFPEYTSPFSPSQYKAAVAYHKQHPDYKGSLAAATKNVPLSDSEKFDNEFAQSGTGAFAGHFANAVTAGAPVALAGDEGLYWEDVSGERHPYASLAGDLAGNVAGAVAGGKLVGGTARGVAEGESVLAPAAKAIVEHPGATQVGVDLAMGAGYGAAEAGPGHRLEGAAYGAATTAALEAGGRAVLAPALRLGREAVAGVVERKAAKVAVPEGFEVESEAPQAAAMAADEGPSVRSVDRIEVAERPPVAPGTAEQRAEAEAVKPQEVTAPALSEVAKAGNINLANIETPEDIDALMRFTAKTFGDFKGERRGVQTWGETEALAKDLGMTPDDLLSRRTGEAFNAEQAHAARGILSASAAETRKLADAAITGSDDDKTAFVKAFLLHAAVTEKVSGAATEAGRALQIYRKVAKASLGDREAMQNAVKRMQDGATPDQLAEMVRQLGEDPAALNRFAREAIKPRFRDKLMFVWINSLLSGPKTHVVNMTSNLLTAAMSLPEHALAAGIGATRKALGGNPDAVLASELGPRFYGMIRGGAESLASAREAFMVGEAGGKVESVVPAIKGRAGRIISIPTRALNAEDVFFKSMARRSELAGLAVRKAKAEGLKGDELKSRIDYYLHNPTDTMMQAINDAALYKTFQRPLGPAGQKVAKAIEGWGWPKLFVPFIRTPTNLVKYAVEHSVAAPMMKEVRNDFAVGGARRDLAIARMTMGTGIAAVVASLAAQGKITGNGPADPSAKRALQANGWQPYSVKVGDEYISYRRLDPWATVMGMAADAVELQSAMTTKQEADTGAVVIGALVQNLSNKTWLSGFSDLIDAITDPQRNAKNALTRLGASMATPTLVSQIAQATDPILRDTTGEGYMETLRKRIEARVPGLSTKLIPRRDILGRKVKAEEGPLGRFISPFDVSTDRHDPDAKAILDSGARFSNPGRTLKGARLPDAMYDIYQSYAGQLTQQYIKGARTDPDWPAMDKAARKKLIEKLKNKARKDARAALMAQ